MKIGIVGPIATENVAEFIRGDPSRLPVGYTYAPLLGTLIGELLRRGHEVSAVTLSNDLPLNLQQAVLATGPRFEIRYCPVRRRAWRPNRLRLGRIVDLYAFERHYLSRSIEQAAPEVVHAHWSYEYALAALATSIPHVITCHDSPYLIARLSSGTRPTRSLYRWLRVLLARRALREARCLTAVSPYTREQVRPLAKANIEVVPNPIDPRAMALGRARQAPSGKRVVLVCNFWVPYKNLQPALQAFGQFHRAYPEAELHLFGSDLSPGGPAEQWCRDHGLLPGLRFHGTVPHVLLLKQLATMDVLLHPSLEESFSMAVAEAMALGLPVVAGESSGAVPWVAGDAGVLCDVRRPEEIVKALRHVFAPEHYGRLSTLGVQRSRERFTASAVVDRYTELYQAAISKQERPPHRAHEHATI